jgi:hypothetical protein
MLVSRRMEGARQFRIDRGGTFTDSVARRPDGTLIADKLLSDDPERYDDAALAGIRKLLKVPRRAPSPAASATRCGRVRFFDPITAAILSGHRRVQPFGAARGSAGTVGRSDVDRASGKRTRSAVAGKWRWAWGTCS